VRERLATQHGVTLRTVLPVIVLQEVLINATFAEGIQAFIDSGGVPEEPRANAAFQVLVEVFLFNLAHQAVTFGGLGRILVQLKVFQRVIHPAVGAV
jgi:hypothetical protein